MKIVIGNYPKPDDSRNLILNDAIYHYRTGQKLSDHFAIVTKVTGLETPPYRNGTGDWSGADGGYLSSQFYGARVITISGAYLEHEALCDVSADVASEYDRVARLYIRSRLPIRERQQIRFFFNNGLTYTTDGYCTDLKMDYDRVNDGEYQITMYCPDPMLYLAASDGSQGTEWFEATLYKAKSVGYVNPYELPVAWGTGGRSSAIDYTGDYAYYPQIIVNGPVTNPAFYSTDTEQLFSLGASAENPTTIEVTSVGDGGAITGFTITNAGAYPTNQAGANLGLETEFGSEGYGATVSVSMSQTQTGDWYATNVALATPGQGYVVGETLTLRAPDCIPLIVSAGQTLVIDMAERTVLVDGVSRSYFINPGSEWISLVPQQINHIVFTSAESTDVQQATIRWRLAHQGV